MLNLIKSFIILFLFLPLILYVYGIGPGAMYGAVEEKAKTPEFSLANYSNGEFQKLFENIVLKNFPKREKFLKIYNTMNLVLFNNISVKARDGLIIGDDDFLFYQKDIYQLAYPYKFYNHEAIKDQVKVIKELQDILSSKVIVLISPNKVDIYEDKIPNKYKSNQNYFSLYYKTLTSTLENEKLSYIDGVEILKQRRKNNLNETLFSKGGYHWSDHGSCIVTRTLLKTAIKGGEQEGISIPSCILDYSTKDHVINDIANLIGVYNNSRFITDYPSLLVHKNKRPHFKKVILIGNSFSYEVKNSLLALADIDKFYRFQYETLQDNPLGQTDLKDVFDNADLVIIEELETGMSLKSSTNVITRYIEEFKKNNLKLGS